MAKPSPSTLENRIVDGRVEASWPLMVDEADLQSLPQWLEQVREQLALVQFVAFLEGLKKGWPPVFEKVKVETQRGNVVLSTTNRPGATDKEITEGENLLRPFFKPFTEDGGKHLGALITDGFEFKSVTKDELDAVLERALAKRPVLRAAVQQLGLDRVLPEAQASSLKRAPGQRL